MTPSGRSGSPAATTSPAASPRFPASPRRCGATPATATTATRASRCGGTHRRWASPETTWWILDTTEPRILIGGGGRGGGQAEAASGDTGISISTGLLTPGDERIVAERLHQVLSARHTLKPVEPPKPPAGDASGVWKVDIQFAAGRSVHTLSLVQRENRVVGTHQGDFIAREVTGTIDGSTMRLETSPSEFHGDNLSFTFTATLAGDTMSGSIDMDEYLSATWTARRG